MASGSRPTTPNSQSRKGSRRHSHRSSGVYLLSQSPKIHYPVDPDNLPLESQTNTEKFERLSDALEELDSNMIDLSSIHEAISNGFNESFASFLYGLSITMWCVDYPGCPTRNNWERLQNVKDIDGRINELTGKVRASKEENERLKEKLAAVETRNVPIQATKAIIPERRKPANESRLLASHSKVSNEDDSYVTNEGSFVAYPSIPNRSSRIPQPVKAGSIRSSKTPGQSEVTVKWANRGPNLNQPPRYMRGLFDSSNTTRIPSSNTSSVRGRKFATNNSNSSRVNKPTKRQPFR